ncbi:MAG: hypothetical protein OXC94_05010, partial [Chloroflexi bacterium]|nr:hypothetical protein [Chloroflexota bacterium]
MPQAAESSHLAEIVPPRDLDGGIASARGMLGALAGERLTLEIAMGPAGPRWYVRGGSGEGLERALAQLRAAYPQARAEPVPAERSDLDPVRLLGAERSAVVELRPSSRDVPALRSDWRGEPSPLTGVLARAAPEGDERVVCRLAIGPAPRGAAGRIERRAERPGRAQRDSAGAPGPSPVPIAAALAGGRAGPPGGGGGLPGGG